MKTLSRFCFVLVAAALLATGCAPSQQTATGPSSNESSEPQIADASGEVRTAPYQVEDITYPELPDFQVPPVQKATLDNGLKVFLIEDHELPTVSASARVGTGSVYEPVDHAGLASITGEVMRTGGTASMSSDEVNQTLEDLGAEISTGIGQTSGSASMSTLAENFDQVLRVFVDVLARPAFSEEKVELAKNQARSAISRRNDNPGQIVSREFQKLVYGPESPYARTTEYYTLDEISREDLSDFHQKYFHPNNTLLSVWGDFDAEAMKQKIREAFSGWEAEEGFEKPSPPEPEGERQYSVHFIQKDDVTQSTIRMGYPGELTRDDPDYFPVIVMNEILSGGFTSRLFQNVRTDQGLAYSVFGQYTAGYDRPGIFIAQVQTKSETTVEATRSVLSEVEKLRSEPPTQNELQLAKDSYLNSFVFNFDTRSEILSRLMTYNYYGYPADFLQKIKSGVEEVTVEDVARVSKKYLHPDQVDILVLGRQQDFSEPLSALAEDGQVQEVDISIPTSPPGEQAEASEATEEEQAAGGELLAEVREALGGDAYDQLENMRQSTETTVNAPQGEQTIESTIAVQLPKQIHAELNTPMGTLTIIDNGEKMVMKSAQGTQPAPPPLRRRVSSQLQRDLTYLMTQADRLEASSQGTQTVDDTEYRALQITTPDGGDPLTLLIDPETTRPARMQFQGRNPQTGAPMEISVAFSNYQETSGIMVPYTTTTYQQDGTAAATATVTNFETNVDFDEGYFSVE